MKKITLTLLGMVLTISSTFAKEPLLDTYNMNRAYEDGNKGNYTEALGFFDKELTDNPQNGYAHLGKVTFF